MTVSWADSWPVRRAYLMALAMQPVEAETHAHLIAARILDGMEEPGCEYEHKTSTCSGKVTHRARDCVEARNCCERGTTVILEVRDNSNAECAECRRKVADCWQVWPI